MSDWPERIRRLTQLHQRLRDLEDEVVQSASPPAPPAQHVRADLPDDYRAFLGAANGWVGFYKGIDLFGSDQLREHESGLLIGASKEAGDQLVLVTSGETRGAVKWFGGGELVDEFEAFGAFFDGIVAQTREEERKLEARR
ncbi:MAG: SMI1/KNR4 family protein [Archangium sp.]|nr:SMI1/KNR4 family protein [Archangium sp.]